MRYVELGFEADLLGQRSSLPPFLGATLRGALGYILKQTVCQIKHGECLRCVLRTACPYPVLFEGLAPQGREIMRRYDKIPQPFVLLVEEPPGNGEAAPRLSWGVRLFGEACRYWPYLVHVYQTAGHCGLGKQRLQYTLRRVTDRVGNTLLWSAEQAQAGQPAIGHVSSGPPVQPDRCVLRWRFHTPVRFQAGPGRLSGIDLVLAGRRRLQIMDYFYGDSGEQEAWRPGERVEATEFTTLASRLRPWRFQRYSGRQRCRMTLDGLVGEIVIEGPWGRSGDWLQAAPLLHLGKAGPGSGQIPRRLPRGLGDSAAGDQRDVP